jgi:hypothetical protein
MHAGGPVTAISIVRDIGVWGPLGITLQVGIPDAALDPPGYVNVVLMGGPVTDLGTWAVLSDGENKLQSVVITPASGIITLTLSSAAVGSTQVIIPSFVNELNSITGATCAGTSLNHEY